MFAPCPYCKCPDVELPSSTDWLKTWDDRPFPCPECGGMVVVEFDADGDSEGYRDASYLVVWDSSP